VALARAWNCTPNEILEHSDRMIVTMMRFLRWETAQARKQRQQPKRR
jgi:hypothetical protein